MRPIRHIILHSSGHALDTARTIARRQRGCGLPEIGFHFVIDLNGDVERGRAIEKAGAHCRGYNQDSIGICLAGAGRATAPQLIAVARLLGRLARRFPDAHIHKVRDLDPSSNDALRLSTSPTTTQQEKIHETQISQTTS